MKEFKGNIWDVVKPDDLVCILTNTTCYEGKNVMGAGIAKEALIRNPDLDQIVAKCIERNNIFLGEDKYSKAMMFRFTTKDNVWEPSKLNLIEESLKRLKNINKFYYKVYLPRPGCGCGGLDWETQVKPLLEKYISDKDNIIICSF